MYMYVVNGPHHGTLTYLTIENIPHNCIYENSEIIQFEIKPLLLPIDPPLWKITLENGNISQPAFTCTYMGAWMGVNRIAN